MNRFFLTAAGIATMATVAGCSSYKATDKILRSNERVIQQTRVHQQPSVIRRVPVAVPQPAQIVTATPPPSIDLRSARVNSTQVVEPIVRETTRVVQPQARVVFVENPTTTVVTGERINVRLLSPVKIRQLQRALATKGYYRAGVDGIFGIRTAQALAAYQRSVGSTGPVTAQTLESLGIRL